MLLVELCCFPVKPLAQFKNIAEYATQLSTLHSSIRYTAQYATQLNMLHSSIRYTAEYALHAS